ncbi:MFS transporter [Pedobacter sp. SYP-B3415]|uniref:MFS transporter n=1 Tax=Pedobacter sp. SYP-B3415 TaxID=2496641 RepID=UPI00101E02F7|nr:MFS transporter [Pedobacter sp. SYP-B3415]
MFSLKDEYSRFAAMPQNVRVLLRTNLIYAAALPLIELFIGTYIIRSSRDMSLVMVFQLAQGAGIPVTFLANGFLLRYVSIARLYGVGMVLSGIAMALVMAWGNLSLKGIALMGFIMGLAYGFFWANRVLLALSSTRDDNRNYYYGLESLFFTFAAIVMPVLAGYFLSSASAYNWLGDNLSNAYYALAGVVIVLTIIASFSLRKGRYQNPQFAPFLFFNFHRLWRKMLFLAGIKGLAQGFIIAAPVMLVMRLLGNEGDVGIIQSVGSALSAILIYSVGKRTAPRHRPYILMASILLFLTGSLINAAFFNAMSTVVFVACLVFSRPLLDLAYFPIQLGVIECVARREGRSQFAYIFSHELGTFGGRLCGCLIFILAARYMSEDIALRFALPAVALLQLLAVKAARSVLEDPEWCEARENAALQAPALQEPAELA